MRPELKASKRAIAKLLGSKKALNDLRKKNGSAPYSNYEIMRQGLIALLSVELRINEKDKK